MHRTLIYFLLLNFTLVTIQTARADVAPGKQIAESVTVKNDAGEDVTVHFWLFLPADYEDKETWPLMLFLHGAGERGDDLELVKKWGPPKLVDEQNRFPFVVVSPQCPRGERWSPKQMAQLVDHVAGSLKIDKSRLYCTGLSMGGYGTWATAAAYPKLFAAVVPICGGGDPETADQLKGVPIWAFHGDKDNAVPLQRSQDMVDAVKKAGGDAKLTVYPGVGHNSWSATYANKQVYEWLLSHTRKN